MKIKKKIIICILLSIGIVLCTCSNVYAAGGAVQLTFDAVIDLLLKLIGSVVGLYTWSWRLLVIAFSVAIQGLMSVLASLGGGTDGFILTPYKILFNKVEAVKIDFFDFSASADFIRTFRQNIAMWYYVLRFIATAILLAILVYIGLRMAISTVAEEKAKYKKMIVDWVTSLALLYLLHYIIVFVINVNTVFVNMLSTVGEDLDLGPMILGLMTSSLSPISGIGGWAALILYVIFTWQTLKFFIMYVKRMMTIGFLILISPLITITYSIDRAGDQKAQALNTWLKEFIYNVLIQPFHCILYLSFAQAAFSSVMVFFADHRDEGMANAIVSFLADSVLAWGPSIAGMVFAILCLVFINSGEKLIREIFGFTKASSVGDLVGAAAIATGTFKYASSIGSAASKAGGIGKAMFPGIENLGKRISDIPIAKSIAESGFGKTMAGFGRTVGSGVVSVGRTVGNTATRVGDNIPVLGGGSLGDMMRRGATSAGNFIADQGQRFTSSVNSLKSHIDTLKRNHPRATAFFGKGKAGAIKYFKGQVSHLADPEALKAAAMVQGIGMGLGMEGSLVQTAMYATVFTSFADFLSSALGTKQSKTARLLAEDIGKNTRTIEVINHKDFTREEEVITQIRETKELGSMGYYDPERIGQTKYNFFRELNNSFIGKESATHSEMASALMEGLEVYENGGNTRSAIMALDAALSAKGHEIDSRKLGQLESLLEDMQRQMANAKFYRAWTEAEKAGVDEDTFAKAIMRFRPTDSYVPDAREAKYNGFNNDFVIIDDHSRQEYNLQEDRADSAAANINDIIRRLNNGLKADLSEDALMAKLSEMADAIRAYQASSHVDEIVLKKMVHTHNITAERTNRIRLSYDAAKVAKLSEVKTFTGSGTSYTQS